MARPTRLTVAKRDIFSTFDAAEKRIYAPKQIGEVLNEHRAFWRLAERTKTTDFIEFLKKQGKLEMHELKSERYERVATRYSWGAVSQFELALSLSPRGYLSHSTAVFLHGLTDLIPEKFYLNVEQSRKPPPSGPLSQKGIDAAFSRRQRELNMTYEYKDWSVTIINGKHSENLGVEDILGPSGEKLRVTNLERTLIDIVVRPTYAGGVFQVFEAYKAARERLSTNRLVATLKKLDYVYPYHQAIGFLMDRAGYESRRTALLQDMGLGYDFFLTHGMVKPEYSDRWRIFYPSGI